MNHNVENAKHLARAVRALREARHELNVVKSHNPQRASRISKSIGDLLPIVIAVRTDFEEVANLAGWSQSEIENVKRFRGKVTNPTE